MTAWLLAAERRTVKVALTVPVFGSVTVTSLMDRVGTASSFVIVPTACAVPSVAFTGPERLTVNVSLGS